MAIEATNIEELEAAYKKFVGEEMDLTANSDASKDNILIYCDAIADGNPLWIDEDYAGKSRFGMITAPPTFLYKVNHGTDVGMYAAGNITVKDIAPMYSGAEWEFFRPIRVNDKFTVKGKFHSFRKVESKTRGAICFTKGEVLYFNQSDELVAISRPTVAMVQITRKSLEAPPIRVHDPAKPGVAAENPDTLAYDRKYERRGAAPRYWEDVEVGEEMTPPLRKGVLTADEITRWSLSVPLKPSRFYMRREEKVVVGMGREALSKLAHGVADPEDFGPQRVGWLGQAVTDWMGDDGTLKKFSCEIRGPNMMGDINIIKGKLTKKYIEAGEHLVDCEISCENQGGNITAPGRATVVLPSKKKGARSS